MLRLAGNKRSSLLCLSMNDKDKSILILFQFVAKKKVEGKTHQGTLDGWVKGEKTTTTTTTSASSATEKKKTAEELEAEMKRLKEQSERFKENMKRRAEENRCQCH